MTCLTAWRCVTCQTAVAWLCLVSSFRQLLWNVWNFFILFFWLFKSVARKWFTSAATLTWFWLQGIYCIWCDVYDVPLAVASSNVLFCGWFAVCGMVGVDNLRVMETRLGCRSKSPQCLIALSNFFPTFLFILCLLISKIFCAEIFWLRFFRCMVSVFWSPGSFRCQFCLLFQCGYEFW